MSFNSTIVGKIDFCIECTDGIKKPVIAGRCKAFHYPKHLKMKSYQKTNERQKQIIEAQKKEPYLKSVIDRRSKDELEKWFDTLAEEISKHPFCMECGEFIPEKFYRHASAHLLPKSIFHSVSTHPNNRLILGAGCGCHYKFDHGFMENMKVFEEAVKRYSTFRLEVKEKHKLLDKFEVALDNEILNKIL